MKKEYDFSKAERGKFFDKNLKLEIPVYLDPVIMEHFLKLAKKNKKEINVLINEALKQNIQYNQSLNQ